ncbi:hypothetical protein Bca101_055285 [Brassica carinata]
MGMDMFLLDSKETLMPTTVNSVSFILTANVLRTHSTPYTSQIMTTVKAYLEKHVCIDHVSYYQTGCYHGFTLGWATALIGFALMFIIKLLSAVSKSNSPKGKKTYSHKQEPSIGYAFNAKSTTRKLTTSLVGSSYVQID